MDDASGDLPVTFSGSQSTPADEQHASWIRAAQPAGSDAMSHAVLPPAYVADLVDRVGPGPIGWAIEVAEGMAGSILDAIPELGVDGVVQEMRRGCEAVAVRMVAALAEEDLDLSHVLTPEVFGGPAEAVIRGVGIEHILRSIQIDHAYAHRQFVEAASLRLEPEHRLAELRRISEELFAITDLLSAGMSAEFSRAQVSSHAASVVSQQLELTLTSRRQQRFLEQLKLNKSGLGCRAEDAHVSPLPGHDESQTYLATAPRSRWRWVVGGAPNQRWLAHTSTLCSL
jgi:hypothetical protein